MSVQLQVKFVEKFAIRRNAISRKTLHLAITFNLSRIQIFVYPILLLKAIGRFLLFACVTADFLVFGIAWYAKLLLTFDRIGWIINFSCSCGKCSERYPVHYVVNGFVVGMPLGNHSFVCTMALSSFLDSLDILPIFASNKLS